MIFLSFFPDALHPSFAYMSTMSWLRLCHILALTWLVTGAAPQVKIGKTTITGTDITGLKLDFFGGTYEVLFSSS